MAPLLSRYATELRWATVLPHVRGDVLDIGCGWTWLPAKLSPQQRYVGIDVHPGAVALSAQRFPQHSFLRCNFDEDPLPLVTGQFDTVVMAAVLEHLHHPAKVLERVRPMLKPGGQLLLTTPSPLGDRIHRIGSRIGLFYPEDEVRHVEIFGHQALLAVLARSGYQVRRFQPFLFGINQFVLCTAGDL